MVGMRAALAIFVGVSSADWFSPHEFETGDRHPKMLRATSAAEQGSKRMAQHWALKAEMAANRAAIHDLDAKFAWLKATFTSQMPNIKAAHETSTVPVSGNEQDISTNTACDLSMWSRGFSRRCCTVHPTEFTQFSAETNWDRERSVDKYWRTTRLPNCTTIYIPAPDMGDFLHTFNSMALDWRTTLVVGQEDVGVPFELFGMGHRSEYSGVRKGRGAGAFNLTQFIADPRLVRLYAQNMDVGCNKYSGCHTLPAELRRKLHPIPIGVDWHTAAEKDNPQVTPCAQQQEFDQVGRLPWHKRKNRIIAPFLCMKARSDRNEFCGYDAHVDYLRTYTKRAELWTIIAGYKFALVPFGHGIDTHRLWEVLGLGTVPIVMSSSLDPLLEGCPAVKLISMHNMTNIRSLLPDKVSFDKTKCRLRMADWVDIVNDAHGAVCPRSRMPPAVTNPYY